jgi:glycosyltransferase involved in cell wall biosynthesis
MIGHDYLSVSVVIPCLNGTQFLVSTIKSILQQDYPNIDCIIVDDSSIDGTIEILKRYGDRIKWVSKPDESQADTIRKNWGWLNQQMKDIFWIEPSWILLGAEK